MTAKPAQMILYYVHYIRVINRNSLGLMARKLLVTEIIEVRPITENCFTQKTQHRIGEQSIYGSHGTTFLIEAAIPERHPI
jgi:hypothetical protein